jgi:carboxypeptidase T
LDDYGASDSVDSLIYRGLYGNSEEEIKAITKLVNSKQIDTVIDIHSYSNAILYPWGHTTEHTQWDTIYKEVGQEMAKAVNNKYYVEQSVSMYPTTGSSEDYHHVEGRFNYTLEIGNSFYPKSKKRIRYAKKPSISND